MSLFKMRLSLGLILFVVFMDNVGFGLVYPLFSSMLFIEGSGFVSPETTDAVKGIYLGILLSIAAFTAFFSGPILGILSDQKGRKPVFIISLSLAILGYAFCIFGVCMRNVIVLIFGRFIQGMAYGNAGVVGAAIADLSDSQNKAKYFGLLSMAAGAGFAIGPFLGGILARAGFTIPFLAAGVATLLNLIFIVFFFRETRQVSKTAVLKCAEGINNLKKAFQLRELKLIFIALVFFGLGWSFFYEFMPVTWISDFKLGADKVGLFFAYGAGFYTLSSGLLIRPFLNRFKPHQILIYSLAILGVLILALPFLKNINLIWIYLPIANFLVALAYPTYTAMISDCADKDSQGEILGLMQSVEALAFGLSPLAGGFLLGLGHHTPMFLGGFSMLIAALILKISLRKPASADGLQKLF